MTHAQLQKTLGKLVTEFGYDDVHLTLRHIRRGEATVTKSRAKNCRAVGAATPGKKRNKPNAVSVVTSLNIANAEKKEILFTLAKKYEAKEFMPNVNHVRDFLNGERDVTRIKSRQQVTSAVFKRLHSLETNKLREMLERGWYGPTKRLEPYARAIEGFGRHRGSAASR